MPPSSWRGALSNLASLVSLRRVTARVALSAGLLGLATQPATALQPRVPMMPTIADEATVRRFKGKHVLKRTSAGQFLRMAGHRSHSSHSSHSSHYSGSSTHFSSSSPQPVSPPTPAPEPTSAAAPEPQPAPEPVAQPEPMPTTRFAADPDPRRPRCQTSTFISRDL
jgi:hypothetical protein